MAFVGRIVSTAAQVVASWAAPLFALGGQRLSGGDPSIALRTLLECLGKADKRCEERAKAVRSLTKSIKSVMGITSHQMEGAARHMELPSTIPILPEPSYIYEYMFVFQAHRPL